MNRTLVLPLALWLHFKPDFFLRPIPYFHFIMVFIASTETHQNGDLWRTKTDKIAWLHISERSACFNYLFLLTAQWLPPTTTLRHLELLKWNLSLPPINLYSRINYILLNNWFVPVATQIYCSSHVPMVRDQPRVKLISCRNNWTWSGNKRTDVVRPGLNTVIT